MIKKKLIRITTVPMSLRYLLPGQMHFMQQNGLEVLMISADGKEWEEIIRNEQCRHLIVPMTRKITPWKDFKCLLQIIKIFKKEKPDIVHTHTPKAGLLGMLAAKICGIRFRVHTVAGLPLMSEKGAKYLLLKNIEKITYAAANHVWPNSNSLLHFIQQRHLTSNKKLRVINKGSSNGINLNRFNNNVLDQALINKAKNSIKYSKDNIYLLCIGRLVADKGIVELVNVFTKQQLLINNLQLILVGQYEDSLDPLPKHTLMKIKNHPNICHIGWSEYVEYFMSIADIFVFPSHREGFPNVLLQAGAMKLPIICSRIAGNIDIVTHKKTGLIFECKNEFQLQEQITFALNNIDQMQEMAAELLQSVQQNFAQENVWNAIFKEYEYLLKN